ncbi:hypothetical protein [Azospirillum canadense]|uniref:hypothetical protein n=1 Tax=Azospirillum canadense TaxID=403962 RepID=UPI002227CA3D|nr:hypothetical protein [Azospirillum canadense]MCW2242780.1 hypothetical protein [Azospirillum canadense]
MSATENTTATVTLRLDGEGRALMEALKASGQGRERAEQRIRLECLVLSSNARGFTETVDPTEVVQRAQAYADFVLGGKAAPGEEPPTDDKAVDDPVERLCRSITEYHRSVVRLAELVGVAVPEELG